MTRRTTKKMTTDKSIPGESTTNKSSENKNTLIRTHIRRKTQLNSTVNAGVKGQQ